MIFHAMWRELVWPELKAVLIERKELPPEGSTDPSERSEQGQ